MKGQEVKSYLLRKALHGLKQEARAWNDTTYELIMSLRLLKSSADGKLYYKLKGSSITLLLLYVHDLLIIGSDKEEINCIKLELTKWYDMNELGSLSTYLQIKFLPVNQGILMNQAQIVERMLKQDNLIDSNPTATPMHEEQADVKLY